MRIGLCNEVIREHSFEEQCRLATELGYEGLELAPFTLSDAPHEIPTAERRRLRRVVESHGLRITGLHWLLVTPEGLSITSDEEPVRRRTLQVMKGLVELCADLGGAVLIHGSPKQRRLREGQDREGAFSSVVELFQEVAESAQEHGVTYCIEPLTPAETNFINNLSEAVELVRAVDSPSFRTMLDTKAARGAEEESAEALLEKWFPQGLIGHVHLNDRNLRGPGQGKDPFFGVLKTLRRLDYQGFIGVEPFDYHPDGRTAAARAIGYLQGLLEALEEQP